VRDVLQSHIQSSTTFYLSVKASFAAVKIKYHLHLQITHICTPDSGLFLRLLSASQDVLRS